MIVYVDVLFVLNVVMNGFLLWSTARIRKVSVKKWRLAYGASLGAGYVVMMWLYPLRWELAAAGNLVVAGSMVWVAIGGSTMVALFKNLAAFLVVNAMFGGGILALHSMVPAADESFGGWLEYQTSPWQVGLTSLMACGLISWWLIRSVWGEAQRKSRVHQYLVQVSIRWRQNELDCIGLVDTGNHLREPISGHAVILAEESLFHSWFDWTRLEPKTQSKTQAQYAPFELADRLPDELRRRCRPVPYRGVEGAGGWLLAWRPDSVRISNGEQESGHRDIWIAMRADGLSSDESYQVVLHPSLAADGHDVPEAVGSVKT